MSDESSIVLSELEKLTEYLGAWKTEIVLGGGVVLLVYDAFIAKTSAEPVGTTDMVWLISRKPLKISTDDQAISSILEQQGYSYRTKIRKGVSWKLCFAR